MNCSVSAITVAGTIGGVGTESIRRLSEYRNAEWKCRFRCVSVEAGGNVVNIFENGSFLMMGVKSLADASRTMDGVAEMLRGMGEKPQLSGLDVVRISVHGSIGHPVDLDKALKHLSAAEYEPELSTALVYSDGRTSAIMNPTGTVLVSSEDESSA